MAYANANNSKDNINRKILQRRNVPLKRRDGGTVNKNILATTVSESLWF